LDKKLSDYELIKTLGSALVYRFKLEPEHFICPYCVSQKSIQILQNNNSLNGKYRCVSCEGEYFIEPRKKLKPIKFDSISK
jgi:transcription elongation factor Elf1